MAQEYMNPEGTDMFKLFFFFIRKRQQGPRRGRGRGHRAHLTHWLLPLSPL